MLVFSGQALRLLLVPMYCWCYNVGVRSRIGLVLGGRWGVVAIRTMEQREQSEAPPRSDRSAALDWVVSSGARWRFVVAEQRQIVRSFFSKS